MISDTETQVVRLMISEGIRISAKVERIVPTNPTEEMLVNLIKTMRNGYIGIEMYLKE